MLGVRACWWSRCGSTDIDWTPARVALLVVAPLAGAVFFGAIFVASASLAFWWIDSGELGNAFTYGGRDFTVVPDARSTAGWFRRRLRVRPRASVSSPTSPALALLGRADPLGLPAWAGWISPAGRAGRGGARPPLVWRAGVRHYRSTGS